MKCACDYCGKEFDPKKGKPNKYCSPYCVRKANSKRKVDFRFGYRKYRNYEDDDRTWRAINEGN